MKKTIAACAVLISLVLTSTAFAHNPVGSAEQACVEDEIVLTASFVNEGYEGTTEVTATDSGGAVLPSGSSPYSQSVTVPGPDRAAGTITFTWTADNGHDGVLEVLYEAVSDCEAPPVTPPPDDNPPPQDEVEIGPPNPPNGEGGNPNGEGPPPSEPRPQPADTLPYTGIPLVPVALFGFGLLGAGVALRRLHRGE